MIFGRRKHQGARDRAAAMVRDAAVAGRITSLDRDRRLQELEYAGTEEEIESYVRDLRLPGHPPPPAWDPPFVPDPTVAPGASHQPVPSDAGGSGAPDAGPPRPSRPEVPDFVRRLAPGMQNAIDSALDQHARRTSQTREPGAGSQPPPFSEPFRQRRHQQHRFGGPVTPPAAANRRNTGCLVAVIVMVCLCMAGPLITGFVTLLAIDLDGAPDVPEQGQVAEQTILSDEGWQDMVTAFEAETGSDRVTAAIVYDDWAVLVASAEGGGRSHRYDGERFVEIRPVEQGLAHFSLREVDVAGLRAGLRRAERGVGNLGSRYLHVWQRTAGDAPVALGWVVGDEATHSVRMGLDGEILHCDC